MLVVGDIFIGKQAFDVIEDLVGFAVVLNATIQEYMIKAGEHLSDKK
ncbi:hypothetical protein H1P_550015 [Hyella patelloides LEGE 07179]|uniref:Uncharacterized protein n=1 Tax=Hyella patelloides LEGE 07179 TaxID=945734 RepID=A0A563W076_9CYAN|nr:hypothetical protein [Hyella patelloides]VEP17104.1 hypothetical protein H1P_550015 [Hyella patelloides LEGE 07179]